MLLDTEIVKKIEFEVTLKNDTKSIKFHQDINPLQKYPLFRKATDLSQGAAIADNLLRDVAPVSSQKITKAAYSKASSSPAVINNNSAAQSSNQPAVPSLFSKPNTLFAPAKPSQPSLPMQTSQPSAPEIQLPNSNPTHKNYDYSLVQISATGFEPEYDEPWLGSHIKSWHGTGFIIDQECNVLR